MVCTPWLHARLSFGKGVVAQSVGQQWIFCSGRSSRLFGADEAGWADEGGVSSSRGGKLGELVSVLPSGGSRRVETSARGKLGARDEACLRRTTSRLG